MEMEKRIIKRLRNARRPINEALKIAERYGGPHDLHLKLGVIWAKIQVEIDTLNSSLRQKRSAHGS
jgi:hypothetical protein